MYNSVKTIGRNYQKISEDNTGDNLTGDIKTFSARSFFLFASINIRKYELIRNGSDLLVPGHLTSKLIMDYLEYESN